MLERDSQRCCVLRPMVDLSVLMANLSCRSGICYPAAAICAEVLSLMGKVGMLSPASFDVSMLRYSRDRVFGISTA